VSSASDKKLSIDDLSPDQAKIYNAAYEWVSDRAGYLLTIGGFAGTGKSTLLGVLASAWKQRGLLVAYVTFTGKASSVLARKLHACGVETSTKLLPSENRRGSSSKFGEYFLGAGERDMTFCGTVHRLIYRPIVNERTEEVEGYAERQTLDREYDLIVIDEASMIGGEMLEKLQKFSIPILAVGDHGQLPPVMDVSTLMVNPKLKLEKIHRQALGSPIIALSRSIREDRIMNRSLADGSALSFALKEDISEVVSNAFSSAEKPIHVGIVCWTNRTRVKLNVMARKARGMTGPPQKGEVLICLRNQPPIYNGMRGVVTGETRDRGDGTLSVQLAFPEEGFKSQRYNICAFQLNREKTFAGLDEVKTVMPHVKRMGEAGDFFDNGYAMTCHKSQGSSFDHCIVFADRPLNFQDEDFRRWAYTAVTRASRKLTVVT
jgi:exodeoxyribonuclease V